MISGKLPNNTVWWLSKDNKKIWIENESLEQEKFKEKKYNIVQDRIFFSKKEVGELTTSRLDSRKYKDAWIIKLEAILDIYPELLDEINRKETEEKKKKSSRNKKDKKQINKDSRNKKEIQKDIKESGKNDNFEPNYVVINKEENKKEKKEVQKNEEKPITYFDINRPYVTWIREEISKSNNGKIVIPVKVLKERMGDEFIKMHDMRVYFGLKKILPSVNIEIILKSIKGQGIMTIETIKMN